MVLVAFAAPKDGGKPRGDGLEDQATIHMHNMVNLTSSGEGHFVQNNEGMTTGDEGTMTSSGSGAGGGAPRREHCPEDRLGYLILRDQKDQKTQRDVPGPSTGVSGQGGEDAGGAAAAADPDDFRGHDPGVCAEARRVHHSETLSDYPIRRNQKATVGPYAKEEREKIQANACRALQRCSWMTTVTSQLQQLRIRGRGWEPMWLAESDEMGLFQRETPREETWETMVERFYAWFEECRAVGMALCMARFLAAGRDSEAYSRWVERPLGSLGVGIPACQGQESSQTPTDFFQWAVGVESRLWMAYQRDQRARSGQGAVEGDVSSLMDNRYRNGRRRVRDSRTPRRGRTAGTNRPSTRDEAGDRGRARYGGASSSHQGRTGRSEYVEVKLDEEERPAHGEPSSGSRDGPRGPPPVLASCGAPNVSQPLTHSPSVQMWKWLLFDRNTYTTPPSRTSKVPESFLPQGVLREISMAHEGMTPQNRAQSTVALITVIRYLMAELAQVMDVADAIARTREGAMETSDLEEEENKGDHTDLMQRTIKPFLDSDGKDTVERRWSRALLRLQKELAGQPKSIRKQHVCRLRQGTGSVEAVTTARWEQLQALLAAVLLDCEDAEGDGRVDPWWLREWAGELSVGVPGFQLPGEPVQVGLQEAQQALQLGNLEVEHDLDQLLRDEEEERVWKERKEREEAEERQRLDAYEAMATQEAAHLKKEAEEFQEWEDRQLMEAMRGEPACKRRCLVSLEAATGSGSTLSISLRARMMPSAESTSTIPVPGVQDPGHSSVTVEMDTVPDLMPYLDFSEYEELYKDWEAGRRTLQTIQAQYGKDVVELLQSQRALLAAEDRDQDLGGGVLDAPGRAVSPTANLVVRGCSPMCAVGQPVPRFGFFESMFGQWKRGERDDQDVLNEFGSIWLELFRTWKKWGLDAIYPALQQELDMTDGETAEGDKPTISHESGVVERYGEVWMVLFQLMATQGLSHAVRESLEGLVQWDVAVLHEVNLLEAHETGNCACAARLVAAGQAAIFGTWDPPGTCDAEKLQLFDQIRTLDKNYPGGLGSYLRNARTLLQASAGGENPLDGWVPSVPQDGFRPEVGSAEFLAYEEFGAQEVSKCCFVIPAGGLGERLGFSGVKFALPAELVTGSCVLGVYCAYLRAFQDLSEASAKKPCRLPLVIMASADTDAGIRELLARHSYFGLDEDQVTILVQEKVAALANSDALLSMAGPYKVATKPHGHGDVHFLLHSAGLVERWLGQGRKWVLFFQDTNTLYLATFLCSLGVSARHSLEVNSVAMPRKAKEAEPLLKANGYAEGDVNGADGLSPFPGNTNELIFALPEYAAQLAKNGGQMPEFINPKYADATRTNFKSPTRLECMMQDYAKLLPPEAKVGFTRYPLEFGYFPCKNDIATAARLAAEGTPPHGAASAENAVYHANCVQLQLLGASVAPARERHWRGGPQLMGPAVVLCPDFAPSLAELRKKLPAPECISIAADSCLELRGSGLVLEHLDLQGALRVVAGPGVTLHICKLTVRNRGREFVALSDAEQDGEAPEELRIRGYRCVDHEVEVVEVFEPGKYSYTDGVLSKETA
eukprot:s793_g7.t5